MRTDSSPSVISSSAMPDDSRSSISFLTLRMSMNPALDISQKLLPLLGLFVCRQQGEFITLRAESDDRADGDIRKIRVLAKLFPRVHVADVNLDERDGDGQQRVAQCHAGVGEGARIER